MSEMNAIEKSNSAPLPPSRRIWLVRLLRFWFGVSDRVRPLPYAASGLALGAFKYTVEAFVIWHYSATIFWPVDFLNPTFGACVRLLQAAPEWIPWSFFIWTLPFMWIAVTMSVRRMADAGESPWAGLLVVIPAVNYVFMLAACCLPSEADAPWFPSSQTPSRDDREKSAALAVGSSLIVGGLMLWCSVYLFSTYGTTLFLGAPLLMGATAGYIYNRAHPRGYWASAGIGFAAVFVGGCALLLFALEGLVCVAMALPLLLPVGALGGLVGKVIADTARRPPIELVGAILALPILAAVESHLVRAPENVVLTTVEIDAPIEVVWKHVIDFPEITEPQAWYFSWGIASPQRARIAGRGVGATRYCNFTTGAFVEPITHWEEPARRAFDVAEQPDPMIELSPYRNVHPPHLNHYLRSTHGEFRLVQLSEGRTLLEGRTWYEFDMFPQSYWTLWSDFFIHRIHERVMLHIKRIAEEDGGRGADDARRAPTQATTF
jgi:uncharacterized membrane protein YhaH (DUF805 family)